MKSTYYRALRRYDIRFKKKFITLLKNVKLIICSCLFFLAEKGHNINLLYAIQCPPLNWITYNKISRFLSQLNQNSTLNPR
jgi:hypothetical protein